MRVNVVLMLVQRRRGWTNIKIAVDQRFMLFHIGLYIYIGLLVGHIGHIIQFKQG